MLVLKQELGLQEFEREFRDELKDLSLDGIEIVFDSLCDTTSGVDFTVTNVRDYLRYQMQVRSLDEVINDYSIDIDPDYEDDADAKIDAVMDYLHYNTFLLGTYEDEGKLIFIFDEF